MHISPDNDKRTAPMATNEVYQFSVVSALMDGVASDGAPLSYLLKHGDTGLGTFRRMQGELIVLDGEIYQMFVDGTVKPARVAGMGGGEWKSIQAEGTGASTSESL
jgi:hypothetical protein